ncbi:GNAT family N-acetyltransferase [Flagellimonas lutimaris]|uniref:GNAT family N-acetyltransferase n=1 Tax=Flagellimonas lutimaris TaxID=475082 RepID=UPI003F5CCAE2
MNIQFQRLTEVKKSEIIALMNNHLVRRQMPLLKGDFDEGICDAFIEAKEQLWNKYGYGPWAIIINKKFVGWGGLQPEHGEADLALVLHPDYWGLGKVLYKHIMAKAFGEMKLESVTVLFPPSRTRIKGLLKLGFKKDKELMIGEEKFFRFRLIKSKFLEKNTLS